MRRFDAQAATFDDTRGLPRHAARGVAAAVTDIAGPGDDLVVLEVGAGTGEVGTELAAMAGRYVGVDVSRPMLDVFGTKLATGVAHRRLLVVADADRGWPVRDRSVGAVFASRSAHLLEPAHVRDQVLRVCVRHGCFLVGRVERSGVKSRLRQQREAVLRERGLAPRSGASRTRALLEILVTAGAEAIEKRSVAAWTGETTAASVLARWESASTMGGLEVAGDVRAEVLADLRTWATEHLGDLDRVETFTEEYTLEGVRLA